MTDSFSDRLLDWYDKHGRKHLPWQQGITPYMVWVSEVMLQQTQTKTVIPYFNNFIAAFPTVDVLATASIDVVLHHWTGLGYYARARNLHKTANMIASEYGGRFPMSVDKLSALPGIGASTAGAIVAICSNRKATILDGNVKRVLTRCFAIEGWPGTTSTAKKLWRVAESLTPEARVADYTQAIMDLGATLCSRSTPACDSCPFEDNCVARQSQRINEFPQKKPKKALPVRSTTMLVLENPQGEWLLQKRASPGLWGGLWTFPEGDEVTDMLREFNMENVHVESQIRLEEFRHTFTHFHLDITPIHVRLHETPSVIAEKTACWYSAKEPMQIGLTKPVTRLLKELG